MTNEFIKPEELDDERLLYWARHHAKKFKQLQDLLNQAQTRHEAFLAEVVSRGLIRDLLGDLRDPDTKA